MKCPTCQNTDLMMTDRSGITIDFCPICRGVWLDRGELDKIIERATGGTQPVQSEPVLNSAGRRAAPVPESESRANYRREWDDDDDDDDRRDQHRRDDDRPRYKKKESFWSQLFDFD